MEQAITGTNLFTLNFTINGLKKQEVLFLNNKINLYSVFQIVPQSTKCKNLCLVYELSVQRNGSV